MLIGAAVCPHPPALGGRDGAPVLPLSLTIGRWLVDRAGWWPALGEVRLDAIAESAPAGVCLAAAAVGDTLDAAGVLGAGGGGDGGFRGQVTYAGAPVEVSCLVAAWHREP